MQLSVIILNYNVRYFLEQCVLSVQSTISTLDAEIIVVDNNSSDESCLMMKTKFPDIKLIQNTTNFGFPKGNNIGVEQASGKYICILNPDTVVAEDTFVKILAFAERQINPGIIGCQLIDGTGNFLPESKRGIPTPWVAFTKISGLYKVFPKWKLFNQYYAQHLDKDQTGKVDILVGAFMFLERDLYIELEGFDEKCFMYADDIDLSYRALQKQKSNFYFHETTVLHYKGESTVKDEKYMKRFQEAMNFFYQKHFKKSWFFEFFIQIGIWFFSFIKMFQGKTKPKPLPESLVFYSSNKNLSEKLPSILKNKVLFVDLKKEKMVNSSLIFKGKSVEIILDNQYVSFKKCIKIIKSLKDKNVTFKIFPKNTNFIIGSNSRNDRGQIIKIE
ncbi:MULTISPECIES: glycosyltransferase family 2 protein [unclassified Flavobacterium]|jgi:GT2 family glycosyltransferase|uniref:glycosyltransferase family 2 protein n=1 Tax=unclassified Flavobacterium TaxID=196869 RepID=UPI0012A92C7D|nr:MULTISPECIES: glycosyltransferase family 2 protein [unclassified Flavobacterium]MBF4486459.1 glycosyltransferase family 2 protein [Flavobacterium sp. CSZ]QGK72582.1 glycosyltransferase [Flavobacterium sp. SLB02]